MKHSILISKIRKSSQKGTGLKRRRPAKKLVATLESLADALPDMPDATLSTKDLDSNSTESRNRKSIRSKPGAAKKREKVVKEERAQFGRNVAVLVTAGIPNAGEEEQKDSLPTINRWAALRAQLNQTVQKGNGT
jgi:hypothetical protein